MLELLLVFLAPPQLAVYVVPVERVWVTVMLSGWASVFTTAAPSSVLMGGVVALVVVNCAIALGSHAPKARRMAFLGVSRDSI